MFQILLTTEKPKFDFCQNGHWQGGLQYFGRIWGAHDHWRSLQCRINQFQAPSDLLVGHFLCHVLLHDQAACGQREPVPPVWRDHFNQSGLQLEHLLSLSHHLQSEQVQQHHHHRNHQRVLDCNTFPN